MKKVFCLLFVIVILSCSIASAEMCLEGKVFFSGTLENRTISFSFSEIDGTVYMPYLFYHGRQFFIPGF